MSWNGYVRVLVNASVGETKLNQSLNGLLEMGNYPALTDDVPNSFPNDNPHLITRVIRDLAGNHFIFEIFLNSVVTQAQVVTKLANKLGFTEQQITNNIDAFEIFAGSSWEERRQAAKAYLTANAVSWEET